MVIFKSLINNFNGAYVCKSTFLPHSVKKHYSTLEMNTFKVMSLRSIINLAYDFKSAFLDIEITITNDISEIASCWFEFCTIVFSGKLSSHCIRVSWLAWLFLLYWGSGNNSLDSVSPTFENKFDEFWIPCDQGISIINWLSSIYSSE